MIPLAARRLPGLAHRGPALFLFLLVMLPLSLLSACRSQPQEQQFQGTTLGTGYHLTLYADLSDADRERLMAGIQGELAHLERHHDALVRTLTASMPGTGTPLALPASSGLLGQLESRMQALAVDRLTTRLGEFGIAHAMVEVGGVVRTRGAPPGGAWRLALGHAGLPADSAARLRLHDAALVQKRLYHNAASPLPRLLAVSVVAATAGEAWQRARWLTASRPGAGMTQTWRDADGMMANDMAAPWEMAQWEMAHWEMAHWEMDSPARLVVETVQGIEIVTTSSLESWLER
jgi:hypothetical protein